MRLTDSEWLIMDALWKNSPISFSELKALVNTNGTSWATNTILTFLGRLEKKGIVEINREHSPYLYRPLKERAYFEKQVLSDVKQRIFHGSLINMISAFFQSEEISQEEMDAAAHIMLCAWRRTIEKVVPKQSHSFRYHFYSSKPYQILATPLFTAASATALATAAPTRSSKALGMI